MVEYINGPINFSHLKKYINGIDKKLLYFFIEIKLTNFEK